jgi:hypothetical protein
VAGAERGEQAVGINGFMRTAADRPRLFGGLEEERVLRRTGEPFVE